MMEGAILHTENLTIHFGGIRAVDGVDFDIRQGQVVAIIGPNGAGKTTFFNLLCGNLKPLSGRIFFKGEDITGLPPYEICRRGISRTFQKISIFPELSVFENVRLGAQTDYGTRGVFRSAFAYEDVLAVAENLLQSAGLKPEADRKAGTLSHGDQRLLDILIGLSTQPELLLLDEPTAGLSAKETREMTLRIRELSRASIPNVIIVEHDMEVVKELASIIYVFHNGRVLCRGSIDEIKSNEKVQEIYFGRVI